MIADQLITQVRNLAQVPDNDEDITDEFILQQGYLGLLERFTQPIVTLRNGTWLHSHTFTTTNGVSRYQLPLRSIVQGLEKIECATGAGLGNANSSQWYLLNVQTNIQATDYEGIAYTGRPSAFTYIGDTVEIYPTPSQDWTIRIWYYLRPSTLADATEAFTPPDGWAADVNSITDNGNGTYTLEVGGSMFEDYEGMVDLQFWRGNCEMLAVNVPLTAPGTGTDITVELTPTQAALVSSGVNSVALIVLVAESPTPFIQLPEELFNALVSYVGAVVLAEKGDAEKAQVFSQKAELAIKNIVDVALPRAKGQPSVFKTRNTYLRRRIGRWGFGGGWGSY